MPYVLVKLFVVFTFNKQPGAGVVGAQPQILVRRVDIKMQRGGLAFAEYVDPRGQWLCPLKRHEDGQWSGACHHRVRNGQHHIPHESHTALASGRLSHGHVGQHTAGCPLCG